MMRSLFGGAALAVALAVALAAASGAQAQSAPTPILVDVGSTGQGVAKQVTGSCNAGQTAVVHTFNNAGSGRVFSGVTDSVGNTYTPGTEALDGTNHLRSYRSVLTANIVGGLTTLTISTSGLSSTPITIASCYSSGVSFDTQGADNGSASATTLTTTAGATTQAVQMTMAIFLSNRWNVATPVPPTGWLTDNTALSGPTFGVETFYANVGAVASKSATINNLSSTLWLAEWVGVVAGGAAPASPASCGLSLLGVC